LDVSEAYKILAEKHDRYGKNWDCCGVPYFQREYDELLKTASIGPGSRVLDLGAGTGGLTLAAFSILGRGVSIVGVDMLGHWLEIARRKAENMRASNIDFRIMNIESLELPDNSFDHVISNFVLCCSFQYDRVVKEAYRVLKQGGRFTYNHPGPHDSLLLTLFDKIFSRYMVKEPSESLRRSREANELQVSMYSRYRDPFVALNTMRAAGYGNVEARIVYHTHSFSSVQNFIDSWFYLGQEDPELTEMGAKNRLALTKELESAFQPFWTGDRYRDEFETVYITGFK
jgi:ubiquinone/menaquinone biosynthesis C-methylase UbiE